MKPLRFTQILIGLPLWLALGFGIPAVAQNNAEQAEALVREGIDAHDKQEYSKAIELYTKAIRLNPQCWDAYYERAYSYFAMGNKHKALIEAQSLYENNQASNESRENAATLTANLLDMMGRPDDALALYKKAVRKFPNSYQLWFNYSVTLYGVGDNDAGQDAVMRALSLKHNHAGSHRLLAASLADKGQYAAGALAGCTFLMFESRGERANQVAKMISQCMQRVVRRDGNNIQLVIGQDSPENSPFTILQLGWAITQAVNPDSLLINTEQKPETVQSLERLFNLCKEQSESSEKLWKLYGELYRALAKAGHSETMAYFVASRIDPEDTVIERWMSENGDKLDRLVSFLDNYQWPD